MIMPPTIGVLALQGAVSEHSRALEAAGAQVRAVRSPDALEGLDGLVIPGGESTAMARLAAPTGLLPAIRSAHQDGLAIFGTCAGLILLADRVADAEALQGFETVGGLDVTVRRNAYGSQLDSFTEQLDVVGLPAGELGPLRAVFIRAPMIEHTGSNVEVLAAADEDSPRPVAVRQDGILATSFHPELTADHRLHRLFVEMAGS